MGGMHVDLSPERLAVPGLNDENSALGQCMSCGFCTIQCPTFVLLRDERDSPRGRVRFAMQILEEGRAATPEAVRHLDRCLSCLGCTSACPFGVDHARLWDRARAVIEETRARPATDRLWRRLLVRILTSPRLFRLALSAAQPGRMLRPLLPRVLGRLIDSAPEKHPAASPLPGPGVFAAVGPRRMRVALLAGCVQQVLGAVIDAATVRLLTRHGCEVLVPAGSGCCGAIPLHLGLPDAARRLARRNIAAWESMVDGGLDAIVANASGCGASVKDYGTLLADDPAWAQRARRIASISRDITELLSDLQLKCVEQVKGFPVALHLPCSLQHGQGIAMTPRRLLEEAGFDVRDAPEGHLCCGSAGTYHVLQPDIADRLGERKAQALVESGAEVIATGNMGCLLHIARFSKTPVVHTVELIDWATGGERPAGLLGVARS